MNVQSSLALSLCLTAFAACQTSRGAPDKVDDALIAELSAPQMQEIRELRVARDYEQDELARAQRDVESAKQLVRVAETERSAAEESLEAAETRVQSARDHGTTSDLENAQELLGRAQLDLQTKRNEIVWRQQQVLQAEAQAELFKQRVALADAQLELAKARAVSQLDRPVAQQLDLEIFERRLREQQTQVQLAEVKADAALQEVNRVEASFRRTRDELKTPPPEDLPPPPEDRP